MSTAAAAAAVATTDSKADPKSDSKNGASRSGGGLTAPPGPAAHSGPPKRSWLPRSIECLRNYNAQTFASDLVAGLTVGLVALAMSMAFAIASDVPPQAGIYTSVVAGFLISALGGSRVQIGGPTGAFVVIVAGIVAKFGMSGLLIVCVLSGLLLLLMGVTGLGAAVKYIPRPVTIGFTNGIAVLIAATQIKDGLGLTTPQMPSDFLGRMEVLAACIGTVNWVAVAITLGSLAVILLWPKVTKRIPGAIVAPVLATVVAAALHLPVATIGSKYGGIPAGLPAPSVPHIDWSSVGSLLPSAFTVAFLGAVQSLFSAVVGDSMSGDRHNSNVELIAQGVANIASPLFGGIPATGAVGRTATNVRSGARTPVAGMVHSLTLLIILLVVAPLAKYIPLATLAAVLFVVSYNMGEWKEVGKIARLGKADIAVWVATFALTVFADLTVAVETGIVMAALLYIYRVGQTTTVAKVTDEYLAEGRAHVLQDKPLPSYVSILRIHGPFLFGTTDKLGEETANLDGFGPVVILRLRNMTAIDATGLYALEKLAARLKASGRTLLLCGARDQPAKLLTRSDFVKQIGAENILPHIDAALARAQVIAEGFGGVGEEVAAEYATHAPV